MKRKRSTKIVATLGPSSSSPEAIAKLFAAGADVFRLNFSHGTHAEHMESYEILRKIESEHNRPIGVIADLQGPKIRVNKFSDGKVKLAADSKFVLDSEIKLAGDNSRISISNPEIFPSLEKGAELLLDDGKIKLLVEKNNGSSVQTKVVIGGVLSNHKGINIPDTLLPMSALTKKDRKDLEFSLGLGVDWIALSFVQRPDDVREARKLVAGKAGILAKLEKPLAIEYLEEIIEVSDAIMVARGDLGVEARPEEVPGLQKK